MNISTIILLIAASIILLLGGIGGCMWGMPKYAVYSQSMRGTADFKEAEINRQIEVEEAKAREEALMLIAKGEAERERIKADASAYAIEVVGEKLSNNPDYLRLHWINEVANSDGERIYIPTEAGMPILEAGRH